MTKDVVLANYYCLFCKISYGTEKKNMRKPLSVIPGKITKLEWILQNQKPGTIMRISYTKDKLLGKNQM